jgi:FHA domain-containing protein
LFSVITLTVIAFNDAPADGSLQCHFDELGGSIGRADTNQLVLPDPERLISRVAAQVVYRNGAFAIVDRGSNPIRHNGHALASGREVALAPGDVVRIGGYELRASAGAAATNPAAASDPFAGLLGPAASTPARGAAMVDPLANVGIASRPAMPAAATPQAQGGIPADWDPFAPQSTANDQRGAPASARRDTLGLDVGSAAPAALVPGLNLPSAAPSSLDQLFGLGPSSGGDPLSNSMLDAPMAQPNMAADADPLRSLGTAPQATAASRADHVPDLQRAFIPPTTIKPPGPVSAPPPAARIATSWDTGASAAAPLATAPAATAPVAARPTAATAPAMVDMPPALAAAPAARPVALARPEDSGALLEAFRRGLSVPTVELPALTPELMELIGQVLHEAVRGTVDLLRARSTVKHELRAQVTTIVAKSNNPLKFSPNAEVALQHLLAPPARGFIAAAPAMRDAYDDLRAHQFAFVAGMQAVVEAALQRFDPAALEGRLGDRSLLHSLVPASRNARLWELFVEHYARIRNDAADDFNTLFGQAFLKAYNEHVDSLQAQHSASRKGT